VFCRAGVRCGRNQATSPYPDMMLESRSLPPRPGKVSPNPACSNLLPAQLLQTPCGTATRSLENVVPAKLAQHFKLPTVIITGGRGHGKFYTLENLVNKRIFPRECEFRINTAIRLRLRAVKGGSPPSVTLTCPSQLLWSCPQSPTCRLS